MTWPAALARLQPMGAVTMRPDELALAVSGLAGIVGFLLLPAAGSWLRIFFRAVEAGRGLGNAPRVTGRSVLLALGLTVATGFFTMAHLRAAGQLREVTREAPVFNTTVSSIAVGVVIWIMYVLLVRRLASPARPRRCASCTPALVSLSPRASRTWHVRLETVCPVVGVAHHPHA